MQPVYMEKSMLPWSVDPRESGRFRKTFALVAVLAMVVGIAIPLIQLPEKTREELEEIPPQLAQVVLEKRVIEKKVEPKPIEPPKEEKKEVKPKEEPKPVEPPKPQPRPQRQVEPKKPVEVKSQTEAARDVAQQSGLLALNDELADMREAMSASSFDSATLNTAAPLKSARSERLVTEVSTRSSGGVDSAQLASVTEKVGVGGRATTRIEAPRAGGGAGSSVAAPASGKGRGKVAVNRSAEEIRRVFNTNTASINAIYNRALRSNPGLQGSILLELTIEPSGMVSACKIVSSELADPELEKRILARVKLFNFGSKDVETQVITYPLVFLPS